MKNKPDKSGLAATSHNHESVSSNSPKKWSESLEEQTHEAIIKIQINPITGKLHLKHINGTFGYIKVNDLVNHHSHCSTLFIRNKREI